MSSRSDSEAGKGVSWNTASRDRHVIFLLVIHHIHNVTFKRKTINSSTKITGQ